MSDKSSFSLIEKKSLKFSRYLSLESGLGENERARLGFYLLVLENITGIQDTEDQLELMSDHDFLSKVKVNGEPIEENNDDLGIDAVYIDDENQSIKLFNFKYREKFLIKKITSINDVNDTNKFFSYILNPERIPYLKDGRTKKFLEEIEKRVESKKEWNIDIYMVSNEIVSDDISSSNLVQSIIETVGANIHTIGTNEITDFIVDKPEKVNAKLIVPQYECFKYTVDPNTNSTDSFILKINMADLIRITSNSCELRDNVPERYDVLQNAVIDGSVLYDNVRGYLGAKKKYNKNILSTLEKDPENFFYFNNGITMIASSIDSRPIPGRKNYEITIKGLRVVNGGQTLRTLYEYNADNFNIDTLDQVSLLLRVFSVDLEQDSGFANQIAEYTNSQNAISAIDLKSIDQIQIQIESFFKDKKIHYARKIGDSGADNIEYDYKISMEKLAQILFSKMGHPEMVTNKKRQLFDSTNYNYYDDIFNENFDYSGAYESVNLYRKIKQASKENYDQKVYYIIYMYYRFKDFSIEKVTEILNNKIREFKKNSEEEYTTEARMIISKRFNKELDKEMKRVF